MRLHRSPESNEHNQNSTHQTYMYNVYDIVIVCLNFDNIFSMSLRKFYFHTCMLQNMTEFVDNKC